MFVPALIALLVSTGCSGSGGPTRSTANFCATYASEKKQFLSDYASVGQGGANESGSQVLEDLIMGLQSLGDVSVILDKLDRVAPSDIEPDVAAVRDSWNGMRGNLGDEASNAFNPSGLVGTMLKGLLMAVQSNGSWERVGNYVQQNCTSA